VRALRAPEAYPRERPSTVESRETHMSWVFLTGESAFKLKKPVRDALRDLSTSSRRRRNCEVEVRLNRPLAPGVYHGVLPLVRSPDGSLRVEAGGVQSSAEPVDWLVHMRRLPEHRMLDRAIESGTARDAGLLRVAERLVAFYAETPRADWTPEIYRAVLARDLETSHREIAALLPGGDAPRDVARAQHAFLEREARLVGGRAAAGRVVEAHGDLRPEHVCLEEDPVIIDRLEFNRRLRLLDTASELAFLSLECERLGAGWIGELFRRTYCERTGDTPPARLWDLYRSQHACTRAALALGHLRDGEVADRRKWVKRAERYVARARECIQRASEAASA